MGKMHAPEADASHCSLWLPRKARHCRFPKVAGFEFCGHHLASRGGTTDERIPCPLDPNHSVFAKDLERHLLVCPRAQEAAAMARCPPRD